MHGSSSRANLPPCYFKSDMNTFQCKLNIQVAGKSFCLIFDAPIVHMSCYCSWKERNKWNVTSFLKFVNSHVCRLKMTRNEGDLKLQFFNQESQGTTSYIEFQVVEWLQ